MNELMKQSRKEHCSQWLLGLGLLLTTK